MMIHKDKCLELGLPLPSSFDNQQTYVIKTISGGIKLNTRKARFIGIHNLHSIASSLARKGYDFTLEHGRVRCPFTNKIPIFPVDILSMSPEQIQLYQESKNR